MPDYWITSDQCDIRSCVRRIQSEFLFLEATISKSLGTQKAASNSDHKPKRWPRSSNSREAKVERKEISTQVCWIDCKDGCRQVEEMHGERRWKFRDTTCREYERTQKTFNAGVWTAGLQNTIANIDETNRLRVRIILDDQTTITIEKFPIIHLELLTIVVLGSKMIKVCSPIDVTSAVQSS